MFGVSQALVAEGCGPMTRVWYFFRWLRTFVPVKVTLGWRRPMAGVLRWCYYSRWRYGELRPIRERDRRTPERRER